MTDGFQKIDLMDKAQTIGQVGASYRGAIQITGPQKNRRKRRLCGSHLVVRSEQLVFKPGSRLLISPDVLKDSHEVYIFQNL